MSDRPPGDAKLARRLSLKKSILIRIVRHAWPAIFFGLAAFLAAPQPSPHAAGPRAATVEDSVRLRMFLDEKPATVSPDGKRVAYALIEPNLKENCNEAVVYVRELPGTNEKYTPRYGGKALLRTRGIRQMQWLADGQHLLVLCRPEGDKGQVARIDQSSGASSAASPRELDVQEFAATPDGRRLALLVSIPDKEQTDRFASPGE